MRAVLTVGHGDRSQLVYTITADQPEPASDEVLVSVGACGLNFHDVFTRRGMPGIKIPLPLIVGSDIAGEIAGLGGEVSDWKVGDRVLIDPVYRDGKKFGLIGEVAHGGRAEFIAVPATQLIKIPDSVSIEAAAALPLAYGTAHRMMVTRGGIREGEKVLILGASGGVGVACVQLAKLAGAEVVACASTEEKISRLKELGADHCINYSERNFAEAVRDIYGKPRITGGGGVDVAVNFTGGNTWKDTQRSVSLSGRVLVCGATAGYELATDARYLWTFEHQIIGSNGWTPDDLRKLLDLAATGAMLPVVDKVLPLAEVAEGERMLEDREVFGKILLRP